MAGRGAELLGLSGAVAADQFEAVRQGLDPRSGEFLRVRRSTDRESADGTTLAKGRSLYDFTLSAPKSISVMAVLGDDRRLIDAHRVAVAEAMAELECLAAARVRRGGANEDRTTRNLMVAVYHHNTSRELDPQIHTHAVAANLTFDGAEDRWKALQASSIYEHRAYLTEVYRNALAREVRSLWAMRSRAAATGRGAIQVSKSAAYRLNCWRSSVNAANSGTERCRHSSRSTVGSPRTTKSRYWFVSRGRTSWSRCRPTT